jgi:hypothetical protein
MPKENNLRYGVIVANKKVDRYIIASYKDADYPLVFNRYVSDSLYGYGEYYDVYQTFTNGEAAEILDLLKAGDSAKARRSLLKIIDKEKPDLEMAGKAQLDDAIPDEWYDAWQEMEYLITCERHISGYFESYVSYDPE